MSTDDLVDRLSKATGPDRELDAEIDCLIRFPDLRPARLDDHEEFQQGIPPGKGHIWCPTGFLMAARYTASIDDALTLVPDLHSGTLEISAPVVGRAGCMLWPMQQHSTGTVSGTGINHAIAICVAALKARARPDSEG